MVNIKRIRERLPGTVGEVAYDSIWTLAFEAFLIISVTASFMMLGSELGPAGYGEYVGLFAIITMTPLFLRDDHGFGWQEISIAMAVMLRARKPDGPCARSSGRACHGGDAVDRA